MLEMEIECKHSFGEYLVVSVFQYIILRLTAKKSATYIFGLETSWAFCI
jgi:hypothetical protein